MGVGNKHRQVDNRLVVRKEVKPTTTQLTKPSYKQLQQVAVQRLGNSAAALGSGSVQN